MNEKIIALSLKDYHDLVDALNLLNLELAHLRCRTELTGKELSGVYTALGRLDAIIRSCDGGFDTGKYG
jgi:hypothetical protein